MPKWNGVHIALGRDADLRQEFDRLVECLPFGQQVRMNKLGARFNTALADLDGTTNTEAARRLGVGFETVRRMREKYKMTPESLRHWQSEMGYKYDSAAAALGVSVVTYANWVAGATRIPYMIGVTCAALLNDLGARSKSPSED
uniref:hypothetical protein n=1 Tax=Castellaniella defragrans TaxID=75697 RepID=UPI00333FCFCC